MKSLHFSLTPVAIDPQGNDQAEEGEYIHRGNGRLKGTEELRGEHDDQDRTANLVTGYFK
jgi:hypothetical protein